MKDELELVRVDSTGALHPIGRTASQQLRARQGSFRILASPQNLIVMRQAGEHGQRDPIREPFLRLSGEIFSPGALCDIVALVGQASWRGELLVLGGGATRSVFFDAGNVIGAQSTAAGERIGEVLYRYGALTKEQVDACAKAVSAELRFGEAAVKLDFVNREQMFQYIGKQAEEIVYATLLVKDGMFYFLDTFDESRLTMRHNITVNALLMEGVRRMDETRYFRERIPSDQHVPARNPDRGPPNEEELVEVYEAVDSVRSVAEICRVVAQGEFDVTRAIFQLVQSGRVVVRSPRPTGPEAVVALFNQAISSVFREVEAVGKSADLREQLASFASGAGVYDAVFHRAGPKEDGTLDSDQIIRNMGGADKIDAALAQWLYDYMAFAVFVAEPFVRTAEAAPASRAGESLAPRQAAQSLTKRIALMIAPLAPKK